MCLWIGLNISIRFNYFENQTIQDFMTQFHVDKFLSNGSLNLYEKNQFFSIPITNSNGFLIEKDHWTSYLLFAPPYLIGKYVIEFCNFYFEPSCYYSFFEIIRLVLGYTLIIFTLVFMKELLVLLGYKLNLNF
ncbi:MAG: hypothetical protein KDD45_11600, partial [Bdellovibrionales bacterium]|nr:hypothetical protein [Bdellovibrionales bacterium]